MKENVNEKITSYVVMGMFAEDKDLFFKRVINLLAKDNLIELLVNGIPTDVQITNIDKALDWAKSKVPSAIKVEPFIDDNYDIRIKIYYLGRMRYFKSQEDADKYVNGSYITDYKNESTLDYNYIGRRTDTTAYTIDKTKDFLAIKWF